SPGEGTGWGSLLPCTGSCVLARVVSSRAMGQEILYCFKCQERITIADLDASNALRFGTRTACRKCVPDLLASLSEKERKDLVSKVQSGPDLRPSSARQ